MEEYVWRLVNSLVGQGTKVKVVCERCEAEVPNGVSWTLFLEVYEVLVGSDLMDFPIN